MRRQRTGVCEETEDRCVCEDPGQETEDRCGICSELGLVQVLGLGGTEVLLVKWRVTTSVSSAGAGGTGMLLV